MKHESLVRKVARGLSALAEELGQSAESLWNWKLRRLGLKGEDQRERPRRRISEQRAAPANTQSRAVSSPKEKA